jgi:nucleotide-binding universal stress UspA family protein
MYRNIVVGTDGSPTASKAVEAAAAMARGMGATLHVVTAYSVTVPAMAAASGFALADTGAGSAMLSDAATQMAQNAVAQLCSGIDSKVHTVPGSAADALIDVAEAVEADLIIVGSKGMTGARRVLGSVPNSVAHGAPCAVLVVKTA